MKNKKNEANDIWMIIGIIVFIKIIIKVVAFSQ